MIRDTSSDDEATSDALEPVVSPLCGRKGPVNRVESAISKTRGTGHSPPGEREDKERGSTVRSRIDDVRRSTT